MPSDETKPVVPTVPRYSRRTVLRTIVGGGTAVGILAVTGCGGGSARNVVKTGDDLVFAPVQLTINAGDTVTWKNSSAGMVHTATCDPSLVVDPANVSRPDGTAPWNSGLIGRDGSWSHTFDVAGEYRYCCLPHEAAGMFGMIIVEA